MIEFTLEELLSLYSTVQSELMELSCTDFEGCERGMINDHTISAKLMELIQLRRRNESKG